MRSLDNPVYAFRREHVCVDKFGEFFVSYHPTHLCYPRYWAHDIRVNYVSVMRLDPDAGEWRPCDRKLENEDQEKKLYVVKELGCVPFFWNNSLMSSNIEFRACENAHFESFKGLVHKLKISEENPGNNLYKKSCNRMTVIQDISPNQVADAQIGSLQKMQLQFWYPPQGKHYIKNVWCPKSLDF